jgi:hypothetical protein
VSAASLFVGPIADNYNPQVIFWFCIPLSASIIIPTGNIPDILEILQILMPHLLRIRCSKKKNVALAKTCTSGGGACL